MKILNLGLLNLFLWGNSCGISLAQENLIVNGGFEEKDFGVLNSRPDAIAQIDKCKNWDSYGESFLSTDIHKASWFSTEDGYWQARCPNRGCDFYFENFDFEANQGATVATHNGGNNKHFAGASNSSTIWNKLSKSPKKESYVKLGFWYSPRGFQETSIKVYLRKQKGIIDDFTDDDLFELASFMIDSDTSNGNIATHTVCNWYYFESDWILIDDLDYPDLQFFHSCGEGCNLPQCWNNDPSYLYYDDVMLLNSECPPTNCDKNWGEISLAVDELHSSTDPFLITGLNNVSNVKVTINTGLGQQFNRIIEINDPANQIAWDGKDINGFEVAAAFYPYTIIAENGCTSKEVAGTIQKVNGDGTLTILNPPSIFSYNSVSRSPQPCCNLNGDITIQNETIIEDHLQGQIEYLATNTITAGPNVIVPAENNIEEQNTVLFQADNMITLLPGFTAENGSDFIAQISPCVTSMKSGFTSKPIANGQSEELAESNEIQHRLIHYPNPSNGVVNMSFYVDEEALPVSLTILNSHGEIVNKVVDNEYKDIGIHEILYDGSSLPAGIYLTNLSIGSKRYSSALVIID